MVDIANKYVYIGAGTGIVSISLLLAFFLQSPEFRVAFSPNISCSGDCINPDDTNCIEYFNITSLNKNYSIRNKGNINLPFAEPEKVRSFKVEQLIANKWKYVNMSKSRTLKAGIVNQYRLKICKNNPKDTIKWGIQSDIGINEDPVFFGIDSKILQRCKTLTQQITKEAVSESKILINNTLCSDFPLNKSCKIVNVQNLTFWQVEGLYVELINTTNCINDGFSINNQILNFTKYGWKGCSRNNNKICCEAPHQSNGNGLCESGEGYCIYDINDLSNAKCTVSQTKQIRELIVE